MDQTGEPSDKIGNLRRLDIFKDLSAGEVEEIDRATTLGTYRKGKIFYMPEDAAESLFLIQEGRVQLYRISAEGKKLVIGQVGPGELFGEMALVGPRTHNTFAEALDDCTLYVMNRREAERLLRTHPQIALRIFAVLGRRLKDAEARLEGIRFKSIAARLASRLLELADEQGSDVVTGFTHQDLGEQIGTYRETTTQTLNAFEDAGLIEIGRKRIRIRDRAGLQRVAEAP